MQVIGDVATRTDANHITFQDDWQLYSGNDLFEIRSHVILTPTPSRLSLALSLAPSLLPSLTVCGYRRKMRAMRRA